MLLSMKLYGTGQWAGSDPSYESHIFSIKVTTFTITSVQVQDFLVNYYEVHEQSEYVRCVKKYILPVLHIFLLDRNGPLVV